MSSLGPNYDLGIFLVVYLTFGVFCYFFFNMGKYFVKTFNKFNQFFALRAQQLLLDVKPEYCSMNT